MKDSKYLNTYINIVLLARLEQRVKSTSIYYESHHITPTSLDGPDTPDNKVLLTPREHFICHQLLFFHYRYIKDEDATFKMAHAFKFMSSRFKQNSYAYEIARNAVSKCMTGKKLSQVTKDRISEAMKGIPCSESKKLALSDKNSKTVHQLDLNGILIRTFKGAAEAAKILNINRKNISSVASGKRKTCGGFKWAFNV